MLSKIWGNKKECQINDWSFFEWFGFTSLINLDKAVKQLAVHDSLFAEAKSTGTYKLYFTYLHAIDYNRSTLNKKWGMVPIANWNHTIFNQWHLLFWLEVKTALLQIT